MQGHRWKFCFVALLHTNLIIEIHGRLNVVIKRFDFCDSKVDYPIKIFATFRIVDKIQYVDGNGTLKVALDNDLLSNYTVELLMGKHYIHVFSFEEKHTCSSMHRYFGEFAYDLERHAQLVPELCPIPVGRYHVHNVPLNFNMVTMQSIPFGHLRITEIATDKNNKLICCIIAEIGNMDL